MKKIVILVICLSILIVRGAIAKDIYVNSGESIQTAIGSAFNNDVIIINPGTYKESISIKNKSLTLKSTNPLDTNVVSSTIIDGNQVENVIKIENDNDEIKIYINGLTIQGGGDDGIDFREKGLINIQNSVISNNIDGGICCIGSLFIDNCLIENNKSYGGGAIYCEGYLNIQNSSIKNNIALDSLSYHGYGGGIFGYFEKSYIKNCIFEKNTASIGGAIYYDNYLGKNEIINCKFDKNISSDSGGAISGCGIIDVKNCILSNNKSKLGGAIYYSYIEEGQNNLSINSCTIVSNDASELGGGIYLESSTGVNITKSILYYNTPQSIYILSEEYSQPTITYSDIDIEYPGNGNLNVDPQLNDNFYPNSNSPCFDKKIGAYEYTEKSSGGGGGGCFIQSLLYFFAH